MYSVKGFDIEQQDRSFLRFFQIILLFSMGALPFISHALDLSFLKPYMGLEYVQRSLAFVDGYGKGNFNKRLPQGNILFGIKFNDYVGLEAGYLFSQATTRTTFMTAGNQTMGIPLGTGQYIISENKINLTGPNFSLVGYLPIGASDFYGIGSLGISWLELKAKSKLLGNYDIIVVTPQDIEKYTRNFVSKKAVYRLTTGLGYSMTSYIGMRVIVGYEATSRFKNMAPKEQTASRISLKNNTLCSIGILAYF